MQSGPNGSYAFVVRADTTVEARPVRVVASRGGLMLIGEGLSAGETVVTDGQYKLRPGARTVITPQGRPARERTASVALGREC